MASYCVVCHDRPADHRCRQCHKLVCDECAFKDDNGVFCCRDCAAAFRSYKQAAERVRPAGTGAAQKLVNLTVTLVLLAVIAAAVYVYGAKKGWFGEQAREKVVEIQRNLMGER
jgi:hypothetical protein